jgi:hypothetical protein
MRKHLELFSNGFDATLEEKLKPANWPYIGYDLINDTVAWSTIVEKEEPLTSGFVDLGLSVMWANCNLGASNPEELGNHLPFIGGSDVNQSGEFAIVGEMTKLEYDPVYQDS